MKKIYLSMIALAVGGTVAAQSTFDFESHSLASESYDNGGPVQGGADFILTDNESIRLDNTYDTTYGSWTGFSISNVTDNTTMDYTNQYSTASGTGAGGSANFGVYHSSGSLSAESANTQITEFKITNTAYAKLAMENGYFVAKQFGSPYNSNGQLDGTNGEDWFKVWIYASSDQGDLDSMEFYLADYRFADSTQDYIIDTWETIDLTQEFSFPVSSLSFSLESTDNDPMFGMNTPAYFAIDDIKTMGSVGLATNESLDIEVYPNPATDFVKVNAPEGKITLVDLQGNILLQQEHKGQSSIDVSNLVTGVYVIRWSNASDSYTNRILVQ
ncbi:MAG: hypothetical protein DCO96_07335 [Fluviicola sp. XM-24bin1]|nr:MAG: hypothetical protein DCO96_07335 [Fluviicola sp. XM-24bin1]